MELAVFESPRVERSTSSLLNTMHLAQRLSVSRRLTQSSNVHDEGSTEIIQAAEIFDFSSILLPCERKIGPTILPRTAELIDNGWRCVRHCRSGEAWHSATDKLQGIDTYGDHRLGDHPKAPNWSINFGDDFEEMLFSTGDGERWLVVNKDTIVGRESLKPGGSTTTPILESIVVNRSSLDPSTHELQWMFTSDNPKIPAPWITLENFNESQRNDGSGFLYGENSFGVRPTLNKTSSEKLEHANASEPDPKFGLINLKQHGGANVYVRLSGKVGKQLRCT